MFGTQAREQALHGQQNQYAQPVQGEHQERTEEDNQTESCCSKITSCFTGCFSCCGNSESEDVEGSKPGFVQTWCHPNPYDEDSDEQNDLLRATHVFLMAGIPVINTVCKIFLTVISCIPGSSSEFVRDIIDIDEWANEGFAAPAKAREILPALFTAVAVTVNPYARMEEDVPKTNCFARKVFETALEYATAGMNRIGYHSSEYSNDSGVVELLKRHVVSRFLFLTATVLYVAEKIVHLGIGLILTACAVATLFRDEDLNIQARKYLGALDVVDHACVGLRATLYPWQNLGRKHDLSRFRDPVAADASQDRVR